MFCSAVIGFWKKWGKGEKLKKVIINVQGGKYGKWEKNIEKGGNVVGHFMVAIGEKVI